MALAGAIAGPFRRAPIGSTPLLTYSKLSTVSIVVHYLDSNALKFLIGDAVDFADSSVPFRKNDMYYIPLRRSGEPAEANAQQC